MSNYSAHPTEYAGQMFRSRHEAKYAALFDEMGWAWTYEPFDLYGWVPDFLIGGDVPLLIEIKPLTMIGRLIRTCVGKLDLANPDEPVLMLGASPSVAAVYVGGDVKGKVAWERSPKSFSITRELSDGTPLIAPHAYTNGVDDSEYVEYLFRVAGNSVQWKKNG